MVKRVWIFYALLASLGVGLRPNAPEAAQRETGRVGCPKCKNDGSEISLLLQRADALYAAFKTKEALQALSRVLELDPQHHEALSKTARVYLEFGDMIPETETNWQEKKLKQYQIAEEYARKAVKADPNGTWGHFYIAASLGKIAGQSSVSTQIDLAEEIRAEVEKAIALDPQNGFAYHVYGIWHRRMAEVGGMSRMLASTFLWRSIPKGTFEQSVDYLQKAIALNSTVIGHRLEIAKSYIGLSKWQVARDALKVTLELPIQFSDDPNHKKEAQQLLEEIKSR